MAKAVEVTKEKKIDVKEFIRETREELQKTSFPSANDVRGTTLIVIINVIFFAIFLFLVDRLWTYVIEGFTWLVNSIVGAL